jgi:tRNA-dihydrouridine synthase A
MLDWTDRHCRYFLRLITHRTLLYTEMVTTGALIHGDRERHLGFDPAEHPVALQLGGSDPESLAACAQLGADRGYDEINLNVGCPSDRVQRGRFGACLMAEPELVAACVAAMVRAVPIPVTVKTRIGVDERDSYEELVHFVRTVADTGCGTFIIHARKAWLSGLSPKENREVPPLRYDIAARIKQDFPGLNIVLNGGIQSLAEARTHLETFDGVMIGRAAYHNPYLLAEAGAIYGDSLTPPSRRAIAAAMLPYIERHLAEGARLHGITRHMLGLFHGQPGGRIWRRQLGEAATRSGSDSRAVQDILDAMPEARREPEPAPGGIY